MVENLSKDITDHCLLAMITLDHETRLNEQVITFHRMSFSYVIID